MLLSMRHFRTHLSFVYFTFIFSTPVKYASAQKMDTISIGASNLNKKRILFGKVTYVVYTKKTRESPSEGIYLSKIDVKQKIYDNKGAIEISQQWDKGDTVVHTATTLLDLSDFSTLLHKTYWKRLGYSTTFDFGFKKITFDGIVTDSVKYATTRDFTESFNKYNLNWHSDLIIFTLLPYAENRAFKINFYDPGFGKPSENIYTVTGSDVLMTFAGKKTACWILEIKIPGGIGYQKFWVNKEDNAILKEEDFYNGTYRYKLKLEVAENN